MKCGSGDIQGYVALGVGVILNVMVWVYTHNKLPVWANVPPAPSVTAVMGSFLGDKEFAYRGAAITMQAFGNQTGQVQALKDYNYENLGGWFFLADSLNKKSNYVPTLAAYYFGGSQDPSKLMPVITYLRQVGTYPEEDKWRFLGHAVYLARHRMENMELAAQLADELAAVYKPGMPGWILQMKSIIRSDMGQKEMAYSLMLETLKAEQDTLDPIEVKYMLDYICNRILTPQEKKLDPLCHEVK